MSLLANIAFNIYCCLQIASVLSFLVMPYVILLTLLFTPLLRYFSLFYIAWWIYDRRTPFLAGRRFPSIKRWGIWQSLVSYFPITLHKTADLDPSKNYLFAYHPHGISALGAFPNFGTNVTKFEDMFPSITVHMLTIGFMYNIPFLRDLVIAGGGGPVDATSIDYKLTKIGPGHSVLIAIGGGAEMALCEPQSLCALKLKTRRGFIRRALKCGAEVVPVFTFNEHRMYDLYIPPEKGTALYYLYKFSEWLNNNPIIYIFWGPAKWNPFIPKKLPLNTVIGAPLDFAEQSKRFPKGEEPPEDVVVECHEIYKEALRKLYEEHQDRFGHENIPLVYV